MRKHTGVGTTFSAASAEWETKSDTATTSKKTCSVYYGT